MDIEHGAHRAPKRRIRSIEQRLRQRGLWWVLAAFAVSRAAAHLAGVRFEDHGVADAWQVIDLELLRHHLLESVFYSHTEPPLFNLFIGVVLNWSPLPAHLTFAACFVALGVVFAGATLDLARSLGVPRWPAIIATIVIVCSPTAILYENWMFPTYPATVLVAVSLAAFARWVRTANLRWLALLGASTAAAVLTLALLHPVWLPVVLALAVLARRPVGRRPMAGLAVAVGLPLVLVGGLVAKNQVLYGVPGLSSWFGMNLARTTTVQAEDGQVRALIAGGRLDPVAAEAPFGPLSQYEGASPPCARSHLGIAVLDGPEKAGGHGANYNDECYLPIYQRYQGAALDLIRIDPEAFWRTKVGAAQITMMPASRFAYVETNRRTIVGYETLYDRYVLAAVDQPTLRERPRHMDELFSGSFPFSVTIALSLVVVVVAGVWGAGRWRRRGATATSATFVAIAALTTFVFVVGTTFELGENNRFRWLVEPVMLLVLVRAAVAVVRWVRSRVRLPSRITIPLATVPRIAPAPALIETSVASAADAEARDQYGSW